MQKLQLKPQQKAVRSYYAALGQFRALDVSHETAVRGAFQTAGTLLVKFLRGVAAAGDAGR